MDIEAFSLSDYALLAKERLERSIWDFFEGGAGEERTLAANSEAFGRVRLRPSVLSGVSGPDTSTKILGRVWDAPVGVAPMAFQALADPSGETATVRGVAAVTNAPVVVSIFASRTVEELAEAACNPLWLQVYCLRDRDAVRRVIERAERAGYEALVLTVDAPRLGRRIRDFRNGFRLPSGIVPVNLETGFDDPAEHARTDFDPRLDWSVIAWLRSVSRLPILLKGVLTGGDAERAVTTGADGIIVSNHGGRQLDGAPSSIESLPEVVEAVARRIPVLLDGGVRRGRDVVAALALGADAVLLGRPVLHGLAVGQEKGVAHVLELLLEELVDVMALSGVGSVSEIGPELVGAGEPRPLHTPAGGGLVRADLHSSVSDPVMDTMNFLNEITMRYPDAISFAPGRPYDGFFNVEQVFTWIRGYLDHLAAEGSSPEQIREALFQYGPSAGRIRGIIAESLRADENIEVPAESIVVTVGCQEAMFLAVRALMAGRDDVLIVSSPCCVGITGAARLLDVEVVAVEERENGLCSDDLEAAILAERARGRRPRAVYVIPDHSNPSGGTMPLDSRIRLLDLAERHDFLILEDSPYRLVSSGVQVPSLKSLDLNKRVIMLGSFAKTVFPGARVGYAVADQPVTAADGSTTLLADELAKIKSMITVNTSPLSQAATAGALLSAGVRVTDLSSANAAYYGDALQYTLACLGRRFPLADRVERGVRWNAPSGGFFLTVEVPFHADNAALTRSAQEFGVIWTPMSYFYPGNGGHRSIRLSISYLTHAEIEEGVDRLAAFIESASR